AIAKRFKVPEGKIIINVERFGNTSAASIPIALDEAIQNGTIKKGDVVGFTTFGAGLTWAASIIRI
ncbi:MAG: 3-oxoacyl-[acyl-carrier-protein] synthase III C-terminal domain-containing protein, partial [Desulfuromonadaceae bacterium]